MRREATFASIYIYRKLERVIWRRQLRRGVDGDQGGVRERAAGDGAGSGMRFVPMTAHCQGW